MIISRVVLLWVCLIASVNKFKESNAVEAFVPTPIFHASFSKSRRLSVLITPLGRPLSLSASSSSSSSSGGSTTNDGTEVDKLPRPNEKEVQWDLFCRYHAKGSSTSWRGNWITYNYLGDVEDSSLASVVYEKQQDGNDVRVTQLHQIVTDATQSTCSTCFDSENVHTFPVAQYTPQSLRRLRLASVGMVNGPTVLRSGIMSTELILSHEDTRVRVIFQHGPAYQRQPRQSDEREEQEVGGLPSGLKFIRALVSREASISSSPGVSNERITDQNDTDSTNSALYVRPVPPYQWFKQWSGTSTTWGENRGEEQWQIDIMEEADSWHERPTGDTLNVWSMRLSGGVLLQCPRFIPSSLPRNDDDDDIDNSFLLSAAVEPMRLAWLPDDNTLRRVEASILAMDQAMLNPDGDIIGFLPPRLAFLRTDVLENVGELEGISLLERQRLLGVEQSEDDETIRPRLDRNNDNPNNQWQ